jgi:hypothetical protein
MSNDALELGLRLAAPQLPPGLRSATLTRCAQQAQIQRRRERNQLRFIYALAGMCVLQLMVGNQLDAQRAALVAGPSSQRVAFAVVPDLSERLRRRSRVIARLMAQPYDGRVLRQV